MDVVDLPLPGGCVCGAVRYRLNAAPLLVYACHCHDCQTRSGSAFALTAVIRTADLEMSGEVERVHVQSHSGRELEHVYCPVCRVRLLVSASAAPDYASLRAGTLDEAGWAVPVVQLYARSAIPWALIPGVPTPEGEIVDYVALARTWRATAPEFRAAADGAGAGV
jgi:hypothetical protein